ncbi:MAG: hypothetical protein K6T78_07940 [Alicyclobacillus sp.]|nr:hypothetical protein [Alicyclobacillus sp.]
MLPLAQGSFSADQVRAALHAVRGDRRVQFRFAQLDKDGNYIRDITTLVQADQGSITMDSGASQIKRSAQFTIKDDGGINWPQDRIQVFGRLYVPPGRILDRYYTFISPTLIEQCGELQEAPQTGGWVEWSNGVFLLSSPTRKYQGSSKYRDVQAYDPMQVLTDYGFLARYVVDQGTNYVDAVKQVLQGAGITLINIDPTDKTLPTWLDWPPDTSRLDVCNTLLQLINYQPLHVDELGYFTAHPYVSPAQRPEEYNYVTDDQSVIFTDATDTADYFSVPNTWVGVVSEPDDIYLTYTYTNDNPNSPTSTVSRGRVITKYVQVNAADLDSLQGLVQKQAQQDSMIHQINFTTAVMPIHSYDDVYHFTHTKLGIDAKFEETSWTMDLKPGGKMTHVAKEVVSLT